MTGFTDKADAQAAASGAAPSAINGQLIDIGTVAAHNIALAIGAADEHVETIRNAIRDEIQAMSSHFTLAIADVQTQYEAETLRLKADYEKSVAEIKSVFTYLETNRGKVAAVLAGVVFLGVLIGHFV